MIYNLISLCGPQGRMRIKPDWEANAASRSATLAGGLTSGFGTDTGCTSPARVADREAAFASQSGFYLMRP